MDEATRQSLRNQLVIMQSISQLLPSANIAQNWINTECQRTTVVLSKADADDAARVTPLAPPLGARRPRQEAQ
jgi:hypothetical protein